MRHTRDRLRTPAADIDSVARGYPYMASRRIAPTTPLRASTRSGHPTRYPAAFGTRRSNTWPVPRDHRRISMHRDLTPRTTLDRYPQGEPAPRRPAVPPQPRTQAVLPQPVRGRRRKRCKRLKNSLARGQDGHGPGLDLCARQYAVLCRRPAGSAVPLGWTERFGGDLGMRKSELSSRVAFRAPLRCDSVRRFGAVAVAIRRAARFLSASRARAGQLVMTVCCALGNGWYT